MRTGLLAILMAAVLFLFTGCAGCPECGSIRRDNDVTTVFTSETIVPEYQYFYNGEILHPKAILGVDKIYTLEGEYWTPIDLTQDQLSSWVQEIETRPTAADNQTGNFQGYVILDPQGTRAGIWYSRFDWGMFKFPGGNVIQAYQPRFRPGGGRFSNHEGSPK